MALHDNSFRSGNDKNTMKTCTRCKKGFPATTEYYHRNNRRVDGLNSACKSCCCEAERSRIAANPKANRDRVRQWQLENKEKRKSYMRRYRSEHAEERHAYNKQWLLDHPEQAQETAKKYRNTHLEQHRETNRRWRETHREQARKSSLRWAHAHRKEKQERSRRYTAQNLDKHRVNEHNRRARIRLAEGTHTAADIEAQLKRQKGRCYYAACGHCKLGDTYHVEHVIPLTREGSRNDMSNIVLACPDCNRKKGKKLPHEWIEGGRLL